GGGATGAGAGAGVRTGGVALVGWLAGDADPGSGVDWLVNRNVATVASTAATTAPAASASPLRRRGVLAVDVCAAAPPSVVGAVAHVGDGAGAGSTTVGWSSRLRRSRSMVSWSTSARADAGRAAGSLARSRVTSAAVSAGPPGCP